MRKPTLLHQARTAVRRLADFLIDRVLDAAAITPALDAHRATHATAADQHTPDRIT